MKKILYLLVLGALLNSACKPDAPEPDPMEEVVETRLSMDVSATFEGENVVIFQDYVNVNGYAMSFEEVRMYLSEISLVKIGGEMVELATVEYFDFDEGTISNSYEVAPGDYEGIVYHVGVPQALNGTDNPDFLVGQYGPESPLNVQNGMYWAWQTGYKFLIYEGRIDGTPDDDTDFPSVYSFHLGKDQFYTEVMVDLPFSISEGQTKHFTVDWQLDKNQYNDSDTIDLSDSSENQFHGDDLELAARFQALLHDALTHTVY
jgi:hypothetical protein